ncbi:MAG: RagB/SusD family nutrient uptake outer membrane protein, partial [Ginsengibacter sp.]
MKLRNILPVAGALITLTLFTNSCSKLLEEHPQAIIVPSFFNTPAGVLGGIAGVYNDLRSVWGTDAFATQTIAGTDEYLSAASATSINFYTYNGLNSSDIEGVISNFSVNWWNIAYKDINTLNGVLQFGQSIDLPDATKKEYLAQAKFLRAFWYFHLVQFFGDVPLHVDFITAASQGDSRQPVADVYAQIIKDLTDASTDLPNKVTDPFLGKAATKPVALYLLAKVYLTRGWLNNTQTDFQQAYTISSGLITDKALYGLDLWDDYGDAFDPKNDYGKETMFVSDHTSNP